MPEETKVRTVTILKIRIRDYRNSRISACTVFPEVIRSKQKIILINVRIDSTYISQAPHLMTSAQNLPPILSILRDFGDLPEAYGRHRREFFQTVGADFEWQIATLASGLYQSCVYSIDGL